MDELLGGAEVDRRIILFGDVQAKHVDVEFAGGGEVGDDELHVRAPQHIWRRADGVGTGLSDWMGASWLT